MMCSTTVRTLNKATGEGLDFRARPTLKGLVGQLEKVQEYFGDTKLKLCYEASYVGFSLQRDLRKRAYECEVVAPSSIPRRAGKSVKTDRIDAADLAEFYANGLLTTVAVPDAEVEQDRDLLRSRQQLMHQQGDLRRHIQSLLRRNGYHYKAECERKTHWRTHHYGWLARTIESCTGSLKVNLSLLFRQLKTMDEILAGYGDEVEALAATPRYQKPVKALTCYSIFMGGHQEPVCVDDHHRDRRREAVCASTPVGVLGGDGHSRIRLAAEIEPAGHHPAG